MSNYVYVLKGLDDQDDYLLFSSDEEISSDELMFLMLENSAEWCEVYKTNGYEDSKNWEFQSILGASKGFGALAGFNFN